MQYVHATKDLLTPDFLHNLHISTFNFNVDGDEFRIDGAFFAKEQNDDLYGYVLYKELSKSKIELVYGGVTKEERGYKTLAAYRNFLDLLFKQYSYVETSVVNTNHRMLKLYMALGFNIIGTKITHKLHRVLVVLAKEVEEAPC